MHLTFLSEAHARAICGWRYPGEYSVYDLPDWEDAVARGLGITHPGVRLREFYAVVSEAGELQGCVRLWAKTSETRVGVGLRPDLCGKGLGAELMRLAKHESWRRYGNKPITLAVRVFNQRAIRCYERAGFASYGTILPRPEEPGEFLAMRCEAEWGIRHFRAEDGDQCVQVIARTLRDYSLSVDLEHIRADICQQHGQYDAPGGTMLVLGAENFVAGLVAVRRFDEQTAELKRFYLYRSFRGKGLGQRLYSEAEAFAHGAGYNRMYVESSRRFFEVQAFYLKNGFELIGAADNEWEDNLYMKQLGGLDPEDS
jgi:GNAT superfamily N-acetyltransferase